MGPRVLVVDDEPALRDSLDRALRAEGYDVETAPDGLVALARLDAREPDAAPPEPDPGRDKSDESDQSPPGKDDGANDGGSPHREEF